MQTILIFVAMIGVIRFMQSKQKKQAQERQNQLNATAKGDQIVTIGGLYGVVDEVNTENKTIVLDIDGIYLTFELTAVKRVVSKAGTVSVDEEVEIIEENDSSNDSSEVVEDAIIEEK